MTSTQFPLEASYLLRPRDGPTVKSAPSTFNLKLESRSHYELVMIVGEEVSSKSRTLMIAQAASWITQGSPIYVLSISYTLLLLYCSYCRSWLWRVVRPPRIREGPTWLYRAKGNPARHAAGAHNSRKDAHQKSSITYDSKYFYRVFKSLFTFLLKLRKVEQKIRQTDTSCVKCKQKLRSSKQTENQLIFKWISVKNGERREIKAEKDDKMMNFSRGIWSARWLE